MACSACFFIEPMTTSPRVTQNLVGCPYKSWIEKMPWQTHSQGKLMEAVPQMTLSLLRWFYLKSSWQNEPTVSLEHISGKPSNTPNHSRVSESAGLAPTIWSFPRESWQSHYPPVLRSLFDTVTGRLYTSWIFKFHSRGGLFCVAFTSPPSPMESKKLWAMVETWRTGSRCSFIWGSADHSVTAGTASAHRFFHGLVVVSFTSSCNLWKNWAHSLRWQTTSGRKKYAIAEQGLSALFSLSCSRCNEKHKVFAMLLNI